jgi:hypothetical protein
MANEMKETHLAAGEWYDAATHQVCCDCGLTHRLEYRRLDGRLQYRAWRDEPETYRSRKMLFGKHAQLVTEMLDSSDKPWQNEGRA